MATTWASIKVGDEVYWHRRKAIVLTINKLDHDFLNPSDKRPHVEVAFSLPAPRDMYGPDVYYDKERKEHRHYDGLYCLLASKPCTYVASDTKV